MDKIERLNLIKKDFLQSKNILSALSDENRQLILFCLLENCYSGGVTVSEIATKINLSRPAVSHHLKILLDNKICDIEHIGTKNYYHITGINEILSLKSLFDNILLFEKERKEEIL